MNLLSVFVDTCLILHTKTLEFLESIPYFVAFPCISRMHLEMADEIDSSKTLHQRFPGDENIRKYID